MIWNQSIPIALASVLLSVSSHAQQRDDFELEPIRYSETEAQDPVAAMNSRIASGELCLDRSSDSAFLGSVLDELGVPVASQVLVFSKTSLQASRILPSRPRALYYSEDCYVGWVKGGSIEIISFDPNLGPVFYLVEPPRAIDLKPEFIRSKDCLSCHTGSRTGGVPGLLVRSVFPDSSGHALLAAGTFLTDDASPLSERWGGWYVTGGNDGPRHMGNALFVPSEEHGGASAEMERDLGTGLSHLSGLFDTSEYLSDQSDIVALMVLEHQIAVHNALTRTSYVTRQTLHRNRIMAEAFGESPDVISETNRNIIRGEVDRLLEAMTFADEVELTGSGVTGGEEFQNAFKMGAELTEDGRSLRDFQLLSRLFKYRLSYMIYSQSFEALPELAKASFYKRLWEILTGTEQDSKFSHLSQSEKKYLRKILVETKSNLPAYWTS